MLKTPPAQTDTVESLCERYQVDLAHARHVAILAVGLFDALQSVHCLPKRMRELVEAGALLHNVGLAVDGPNHHFAGRDIIIASALQGFDPAERAILACIARFHCAAVDPAVESLMGALTALQQRQALILSALVRVADGLDYSQSQTTMLDFVDVNGLETGDGAASLPSILQVRVAGPYSHEDAIRASSKADLWSTLFSAMQFTGRLTRPGISVDDTLACAGRRTLRYQLESLAPGEWGVETGDQPSTKTIHHLHVMTRRLRVTLRVFRPYYKPKAMQPLTKGVRMLAKQLRFAREWDVCLSALKKHIGSGDEETRAGMQPLLAEWRLQRKVVRSALVRYLQSERHIQWLDTFSAFVQSEAVDRSAEPGQPSHLRHAIGPLLAQHIAEVKAYDILPAVPSVEQIHALRIAIKRLRYIADALREVLPEERVGDILARCAAAQDDYGALMDAHMAATQALQFVAGHRDSHPPEMLRSAVVFAQCQHRIVEEHMSQWRSYLDPLLMI